MLYFSFRIYNFLNCRLLHFSSRIIYSVMQALLKCRTLPLSAMLLYIFLVLRIVNGLVIIYNLVTVPVIVQVMSFFLVSVFRVSSFSFYASWFIFNAALWPRTSHIIKFFSKWDKLFMIFLIKCYVHHISPKAPISVTYFVF